MNRILLSILLLALSACQPAYLVDENSPSYPPPAGSRFALKQVLTIPANSAHVVLQGGRSVSLNKLNQYHPHCRLEVQEVRETPQSVMPDEFLVKRVRREATVVARAGLMKAGLLNAQDMGPSFFIYRTVFDLESPRQPQVRWLSCEQWGHPAMGNHLSIREIRLALGEVVALTLPSGATGEVH